MEKGLVRGGLLNKKERREGPRGQNCPFFFLSSHEKIEEGVGGAGGLGPAALGAWGGHGGGGNGEESERIRFPSSP